MNDKLNFAAIDFEIANFHRESICSVGLVIIRNGKIADKFYSLIRPEPEWYLPFFTNIHGISEADTCNVEIFPAVWNKIMPLIADLPLAAHNSSFDESCLKAAHRTYQMDYPDYQFLCTYRAARKMFKNMPNYQLQTVAAHCGYHLKNHHHALADAEACAAIALKILT